jgi:hypothetical protein
MWAGVYEAYTNFFSTLRVFAQICESSVDNMQVDSAVQAVQQSWIGVRLLHSIPNHPFHFRKTRIISNIRKSVIVQVLEQ